MKTPAPSLLDPSQASVNTRLEQFRTQVLGTKPRQKDWRRTVGTFPRDEITIEAERLGREWRSKTQDS